MLVFVLYPSITPNGVIDGRLTVSLLRFALPTFEKQEFLIPWSNSRWQTHNWLHLYTSHKSNKSHISMLITSTSISGLAPVQVTWLKSTPLLDSHGSWKSRDQNHCVGFRIIQRFKTKQSLINKEVLYIFINLSLTVDLPHVSKFSRYRPAPTSWVKSECKCSMICIISLLRGQRVETFVSAVKCKTFPQLPVKQLILKEPEMKLQGA